jgi:mono/diheme cytochrome c family protein
LVAAVLIVVVGFGTWLVLRSDSGAPDSGPQAQLARGREVFTANCATCHGHDLRGTFVGPPFLDEIYAPAHHPDDAFRAAVANGVEPHHWDFAAMPPITGLRDADVDAVIAYVRSVQAEHGIGPEEAGS